MQYFSGDIKQLIMFEFDNLSRYVAVRFVDNGRNDECHNLKFIFVEMFFLSYYFYNLFSSQFELFS